MACALPNVARDLPNLARGPPNTARDLPNLAHIHPMAGARAARCASMRLDAPRCASMLRLDKIPTQIWHRPSMIRHIPSPIWQAHALLDRLEAAASAARRTATQRLLLLQLFESRMLDERLLPGGDYAVPVVHSEGIELHERMRSDRSEKASALKTACDA
eukprot:2555780-Prymnesium_polylepis.1